MIKEEINDIVNKNLKEIIKIRRDIHEYPELGLNEYRTSSLIYDELKKLDLKVEKGERVIIVMGAVNVMKPRVSGTLNKYILCIA